MYRYINYGFWSEEVICHQLSYIVSKPWRDNFDPYPKSSIILLIKIIDYINYDLNKLFKFLNLFQIKYEVKATNNKPSDQVYNFTSDWPNTQYCES